MQLSLIYLVSWLLYIQGELEMMEFTYSDLVHNLKRIKTNNYLSVGSYYIEADNWLRHFELVLPAALDLASLTCLNHECRL